MMRTTSENNTVTIFIDGRIDTNNAAQTEKEIFDAIGDNTNVVIDAENLEYISSAGLRVLLATQKAMGEPGSMVIRNVTDEVREIFEVTGFMDILTVE